MVLSAVLCSKHCWTAGCRLVVMVAAERRLRTVSENVSELRTCYHPAGGSSSSMRWKCLFCSCEAVFKVASFLERSRRDRQSMVALQNKTLLMALNRSRCSAANINMEFIENMLRKERRHKHLKSLTTSKSHTKQNTLRPSPLLELNPRS